MNMRSRLLGIIALAAVSLAAAATGYRLPLGHEG